VESRIETVPSRRAGSPALTIMVGALAGLTWAAALRAFMIEIAGEASVFDWWGTFGAILIPGAIVGGLLGWGAARRVSGRGSRWFLLAPLLLAIAPLLQPGALIALFTTGLGGGAVGVALAIIGGGFALSGRGPLWARVLVAVPSVALTVGLAITGMVVDGSRLALASPRGLWLALMVVGLMILAVLATARGGGRGRGVAVPARAAAVPSASAPLS
jgi:hypothetical protein